jgi:hypothetical protein
MKRPISWLGAGMGALLLLVAVAYAGEEEEKVSLDNVPKPVMEAVKARFKDAVITGAAKEKDDDEKPVYEVSLNLKGQTIDVILAPEGEIRLIEKRITFEDLPDAVAKALRDKYPKATYKIVEEMTAVEKGNEKLAYYEALLVTAEKKEREVKLTAEGKVVTDEEAED